MKKAKKVAAAILSTVMAVTMGTSIVSAEVDSSNMISFTISDDDNLTSDVYASSEFVVNEHNEFNHIFVWKATKVIVKLKNENTPSVSKDLEIQKLSRYQIKKMQNDDVWHSLYLLDMDINDNVYCISNFNSEEAAEEYCTDILKDTNIDYAEPVTYIETSAAYPEGETAIADYMKKNGADSTGFSEDQFGFTLTFDSAESANAFKPSDVAGFTDNISIFTVNANKMYFQFKNETEGKAIAKVLNALQNTEKVNKVGIMPYTWLEEAESKTCEIPRDYPVGDTNYSDSVDLYDVVNISKHILGMEDLDEMQQILADYDNNGKVDLYDAIAIAKTLI